jgi:Type II secretion system (T2SS), protein E, N-terminal domain
MSTPLRERPDAPLGTLIFRAGLLPAETIENALEEGVKTGRRLGEILVERNLIKEEDLTRLLAGQKGLPYVSLRERPVEVDAARLLAEDQARLFTALPIGFEDGMPVVAVADPTNDVLNRNIREALGQEARFVVVARSELNEVIGEVFSGAYQPANGAEPELRIAEAQAPNVDSRVPLPDPELEAEAAYEPEVELETAPETAVGEPEPEIPAEAEPVAPAPETVSSAAAQEPAQTYEPEPAEGESEPLAPVLEAPTPEADPVYEQRPVYEDEPEPAAPVPVAEVEPEAEPALESPTPVAEAEPEAGPALESPTPVAEAEPEAGTEPALEPPIRVAEAEPEAEPEPAVSQAVPVATEPVASQTDPGSNGQVPEDFEDDTPPPAPASEVGFRVSIRLTSGEKLTVADCADIGEAKGYAKALTKQLGAADSDDWPFVNGRFLKPDTIVSVDVEPL